MKTGKSPGENPRFRMKVLGKFLNASTETKQILLINYVFKIKGSASGLFNLLALISLRKFTLFSCDLSFKFVVLF